MGAAEKIEKWSHFPKKMSLGEILPHFIEMGWISEIEAKKQLKRFEKDPRHPFLILALAKLKDSSVPPKLITMEEMTKWLAKASGFPYLYIDAMKIDTAIVTSVIPDKYAKRLEVLPIAVNKDSVTLATAEPFNLHWYQELTRFLKKEIKLVVASPDQITRYHQEFYSVQRAIKKIEVKEKRSRFELKKAGSLDELDKLVEFGKRRNLTSEDSSVVNIVDWLLQFAFDERASDIHLEPKKGLCTIRFRVDGILRVVYRFDPEVFLPIISRLKVVAEMKVDEKRKPQDGRIKHFITESESVEMRVSTIPTHHGEKMVIRFFDPELTYKEMDSLGFYKEDLAVWNDIIRHSNGIILVTGPTGSGKTTTLYTSLTQVATTEVNVCTVEDPIEMLNDNFNQMQVNKDIGVDFSNAIKSFLRQDPDIIMVGEIRDLATAEMAIQASLTGHMVFSTLHTNSVMSSLVRLTDLGLPMFLVNATIKCILSQRLVRTLCSHCCEEIDTPIDKWNLLFKKEGIAPPKKVFKEVGCNSCKGTGFIGRVCIYEMVPFGNEEKAQLVEGMNLTTIEKIFEGKYTTMRAVGARRIIEGMTTIGEVYKVVV
ncbi:MAG: Flp pilus assembly complex ATPase component TadA [Bacteriovoracaceae bacterium]|jgi:general secretion pathway protein E|nr:Flp pilus assembly complex ATPase component TadA [Bacteriovoracaceae bacterium]